VRRRIDSGLHLKQAALKLGFVSADEFDRLVDLQARRKPFPLKR